MTSQVSVALERNDGISHQMQTHELGRKESRPCSLPLSQAPVYRVGSWGFVPLESNVVTILVPREFCLGNSQSRPRPAKHNKAAN